jgi:hypothetical protein
MDISKTFSPEKLLIMENLNNKLLNKNSKPNHNIIFVYCPPKVGSTTLVSSIRLSAAQKFSVIHIHDETFFSAIDKTINSTEIKVEDLINYNKFLGKNVYVVDIFRSPIERKISEFFEHISVLHFNNSEKNINTYNIDRIINRFNNIFPYLGNSDYYKDKYNLLQIPETFDFNNKYLLQEMNEIKYIKLRLNDSSSWGNILTNILETPIIIVNDYETEKKQIADIFIKFKSLYKIPENFLEEIKNCKSLNYYYTEEERMEYLNLWSSKKTAFHKCYSFDEYTFYNKLCLENQHRNAIQVEHYIDLGCLCFACSLKRKEIISKASRGEKISEKIIHLDAVNNVKKVIEKKNKKIQSNVNHINSLIKNSTIKKTGFSEKFVKNNMRNIVNS